MQYGTEVLNPPNGGKPQFSAADAEAHFAPLYEDKHRGKKYKAPPGCKRPPTPTKFKFNLSKLEREQLKEAVRKKRNKNAPGLNGIPFLVYKKCPKVLDVLLEILNRVWEDKKIPSSWQKLPSFFLLNLMMI